MIWYALFAIVGGVWIFQGVYLILWSLFTIIRHALFGAGADYRD